MTDPRWRDIKPRPRPETCLNCGSGGLAPHCDLPSCPWAQCHSCQHTSGTVLGKTCSTSGIAIRGSMPEIPPAADG